MTITVIGATGQQGSAVVDALVDRGVAVRAVTRDPRSSSATVLTKRGVQVASADLNDQSSICSVLDGAEAVFAMTTYAGPAGTEGEVRQGRAIAAAAEATEVPFVLYSSVGGAERHTGIPHFESKRRIEESFLETSRRVSFLRPTFFMENLIRMIRDDTHPASVAMPLPDGIPLQMISVRDIGKAAAALLLDGGDAPPSLEIAGDELTGTQIAQRITEQLDSAATYTEAPLEVLGDDEDRKAMFRWFTKLPAYQADFDDTRRWVPDVEDFAAWWKRTS